MTLAAHTEVGGYPLIYLTHAGDTLCAECAEHEQGVRPLVHWEGCAIGCDECGEVIESAYGEGDTNDI